MNARTKNVSIAKETIDICKHKFYVSSNGKTVDISKELDEALGGTVYYPGDEDIEGEIFFRLPTIEVINERTAQAAIRLAAAGKTNLVALNFASARNQGGGFLSGAMAQEEDLCRSSGLYPCLKKKPLFYNANIMCDNTFYTDGIIYSPNVPFFRNEHHLLVDDPFTLSIISAPAPNVQGMKDVDEETLSTVLYSRAIQILRVANKNGHKNIILGAWGCGAFGNSPRMVANIFKAALNLVPAFEHVCFASYDDRTPPHVFETFKEVLGQ